MSGERREAFWFCPLDLEEGVPHSGIACFTVRAISRNRPESSRDCLEECAAQHSGSDGMRFVRYALGPFHRSRRCLQGQVGAIAGARPHSTQRGFGTPGDRISCSRKLNLSTSAGQRGLPEAGPLAAYARLVGEGKIREDEHQLAALHILQEVCTFYVSLRMLLVWVPGTRCRALSIRQM